MDIFEFILNTGGGKVTKKKFKGKEYAVVPTVIIVEGVHAGNNGPILYKEKELVKSVPSWNGRPVVVYHPMGKDGTPISAASTPEVLEKSEIGMTFNTEWDKKKKKLRTEAWIDPVRADAVDKRIMEAVNARKMMEVSSGLHTDTDSTPGVWNNEAFNGEATNHRPDHLAILPDKIGACSIAKGAGLLQVNESTMEDNRLETLIHALEVVGVELIDNELSFNTVTEQLCSLLAAKFGEPGKYWRGYVCEVFADHAIFRPGEMLDRDKLQRISYTVENDVVSLSGEAVDVVRTVVYTTNTDPAPVPDPEPEVPVVNEKTKIINALITNGMFVEADRPKLEAMDETILAKIKPATPAPVPAVVPAPVPAPTINEVKKTLVQIVEESPPEIREVLQQGLEMMANERQSIVTKILAHPKNQFKQERLTSMSINDLRATAMLLPEEVVTPTQTAHPSYAGAFGPLPTINQADPVGKVPGKGEGLKPVRIDYSSGKAKLVD